MPALAQDRGESVPAFVGESRDLGPADPQATITIALHLKSAGSLGAILQRLYDPASPTYRQWLSAPQIAAALAPSQRDAATIRQFLAAHHLSLIEQAHGRVLAQGSVADVEAAFRVALHMFEVNGQIVRANTTAPSIPGPAGALVSSVGGLVDHRMSPHWTARTAPDGTPVAPVPLNATPNGQFFSAQCFSAPVQETFTSSAATATYSGNHYGPTATGGKGTSQNCGYQPSDVWTAYGLTALQGLGLDGTGETIAIVEAYGSTTIGRDLSAFSDVYHLPIPNSNTFTVVGTSTGSTYTSNPTLKNWAMETTLDVEWAHAIAPGAKIVLVVAPDNSEIHLSQAVATAAAQPGVVVISNSYGTPESQVTQAEFTAFETANQAAAASGISVQYSTGDSGDYVTSLRHSDVSYPASSPWATAVGGVSAGVGTDGSLSMQTGWGMNVTQVANTVNAPTVLPLHKGFSMGAGGGASGVFSKPAFQQGLSGINRQTPDISWIADPYTGVEIIYTGNAKGQWLTTVIGGTSAATPMVSALWSIAAQRAGLKLGQAAQMLYSLGSQAITDVLPANSTTNVSGVIQTVSPVKTYNETAATLALPLGGNSTFLSVLDNGNVITFGTDSSLKIAPGWDEVTGLGTPNGLPFIEAAAGH